MRIVVCMKQVYDLATVRVSSRGEMDMRDARLTVNPADLCALEEALKIKDTLGAEVIAITLGSPETEDALREALALGADRAVLLNDPLFAGSDAAGVSYALARAVETIGAVDVVLAGARSQDDNGGQVGPHIAEFLGLPQITAAVELEVAAGHARAVQCLEDGNRRIAVSLPAVVTVEDGSNVPRLAHAGRVMNAYKGETLQTWSAADVAAEAEKVGAGAAFVVARRSFAPEAEAKANILTGAAADAAAALAARLRKRGLV